MSKIKVAVSGYGVIGKRVADAVRRQEDMELIGVADVVTDGRNQFSASSTRVDSSAPEAGVWVG